MPRLKSPTDNGNNFLHNAYRDTKLAIKGLGVLIIKAYIANLLNDREFVCW